MLVLQKSLTDLVAADLMTRELVKLTEDMPLRYAARLLLDNHVTGAPVVDKESRCIGVLSTTDFALVKCPDDISTGPPALPQTCRFLKKGRSPTGDAVVLCTLPAGVCPIQSRWWDRSGNEMLMCTQPHAVMGDWQVVETEQLPTSSVAGWMTPDPVTVAAQTTLCTLARKLIDAHVHRLVVVDIDGKPIGIVSSTDILAAVAYADEKS
jgi:CBS domain-containing protein